MLKRIFLAVVLIGCSGSVERTSTGDGDVAFVMPDGSGAPPDGQFSNDSGPPDPRSEDTPDAGSPPPEDVEEPQDTGPDPADGVEPEDVPGVTPDPGGTAFDNGQTDPGGFLSEEVSQDCEALDLPISWAGTFDGDITSTWGDVSVDGTLAFELGCLGAKLVVWGEMTGLGEGQPFELKIQGSYNPATQEMNAKLVDGSVQLFWLVPIAFTGDIEGAFDGAQFSGTWTGTNTDKQVLDASGDGTWVASSQ